MPSEASHFAVVLERIALNTLAQFRDITDADLNRPLDLPESNEIGSFLNDKFPSASSVSNS